MLYTFLEGKRCISWQIEKEKASRRHFFLNTVVPILAMDLDYFLLEMK